MALFRGNSCFKYFQNLCLLEMRIVRNMSVAKKPVLYGDEISPPVRFAMMTASLLNIDLEFHNVDLFKAENRSEFYKKINPLQKVPALSVDGNIICDSHAIALYFCRTSNTQELYPEATLLRAKIDELLYFNAGVLFPIDSEIFCDFFAGIWPADELMVYKWNSLIDHLEQKLSDQKFLTGDKMRLCDIACGTTVSSLEILVPLLYRHKNVKNWLETLNSVSCFEVNKRGLKRLQSFVDYLKSQW